MDQRRYLQLVGQLEVDSTISPMAFRTKVMLLSFAAYFVLFGTLIGLAVLIYWGFSTAQASHSTFNMIRIGLFALVMLPVFFVVLSMFFMRLPPPTGRVISPDEAPRLFEAIEKMRAKLGGPPIHQVLIDQEYNAAISQLPKFGLFGGHTNYLMLGLPYLLGVPRKEMLATVAHEYGHLCSDHGKVGAWVYRQRRTFGALYEQVRDASEGNWVHAGMARMLDRFMPYYNAYTFVLSRQNEYEADRVASELVGAAVNVSGLVRDALLGRWIHEVFWPKLYKQADSSSHPLFKPFSGMRTAFKASHEQWATPENLAQAWREKSGLLDTHPALRDRVEATGEAPVLPACVEVSAAEALLGSGTTKRLIEEFDQNWWQAERSNWEARYRYVTRSQKRLSELSSVPLGDLPLSDLQEFALLKWEFDSASAAKPVLEFLLRKKLGPLPKAAFCYGRILLGEGNALGLDHLETAAANDSSLIGDVAHIGYDYLMQNRNEDGAAAWWEKIVSLQDNE